MKGNYFKLRNLSCLTTDVGHLNMSSAPECELLVTF